MKNPLTNIERVLDSHFFGEGTTRTKGKIESLGVWLVRCLSCQAVAQGTYDSPSPYSTLYVKNALEGDGWARYGGGDHWRCRSCTEKNSATTRMPGS